MKSLAQRQRSQGAIYQRANGQWCGSLELGRDQTGKRKRKVVYGLTERDVERKIQTVRQRQADGAVITSAEDRMADFLRRWFKTLHPRPQGKYSPNTLYEYGRKLERELIPRLGHIAVGELNADHIEAFQESMFANGLSSQTVLNARNLLRLAVKYAMRRRMLLHNPIDLVEAPPASVGTGRALEPTEAQRFLVAIAGHRLEAAFLMELALGLRRSEALGLEWADVDVAKGQVRIHQGLHRRGRETFIIQPKSRRGNRSLVLPRRLVEALRRRHIQRLEEELLAGATWQGSPYVFCTARGADPSPNTYSSELTRILRSAGLGDVRGHDLRHSASSILQALGLPPLATMGVLGHSSPAMTMGIYGHMLDASRYQAAQLMDQYLDEVSS
jgi:integrase